ncbi:hypothetical protein [Paludisphaera sp.]|uniref:hypothetical protein n=1 Tax=Paludisphaera sp. TaxID=2017432 RepID=UPI00301D4AAF
MTPARTHAVRRRPTIASSSRDMAMLRVAPVDSISLPRAHAAHRQASGAFRLHDRPSGEDVLVYTPMFRSQFESGHRAGRWYVRPVTSVGGSPHSIPFASAKEAIDAVGRDAWRLRVFRDDRVARRQRPRLRVIWASLDSQD